MEEQDKRWLLGFYNPIWESIKDKMDLLEVDNIMPFAKQGDFSKYGEIKDKTILRFYKCLNWWKLSWKTKTNPKIEGTFEFIPFERIISNSWDDDLGGNDWAPDMKGFRPLDMFYNSDGFVGFYIGRNDKKGLYLVHSDSSISPLNIDLEGYLNLLGLSKGFGWWQNALVEISTGIDQPNVDSFKENMPKIFPEFNYEEFVSMYNSLRLDNSK